MGGLLFFFQPSGWPRSYPIRRRAFLNSEDHDSVKWLGAYTDKRNALDRNILIYIGTIVAKRFGPNEWAIRAVLVMNKQTVTGRERAIVCEEDGRCGSGLFDLARIMGGAFGGAGAWRRSESIIIYGRCAQAIQSGSYFLCEIGPSR